MIVVRNLTKRYEWPGGETVTALEDVSVDLAAGELVALVGHPGAGKSTLMHVLCGLKRPTSGTVRVDGVAVHELDDEGRRGFLRARVAGLVLGTPRAGPGAAEETEVALVVADDPTYGAGAVERAATIARLEELRGPARCVVVATHDPGVTSVADTVLEVERGHVWKP